FAARTDDKIVIAVSLRFPDQLALLEVDVCDVVKYDVDILESCEDLLQIDLNGILSNPVCSDFMDLCQQGMVRIAIDKRDSNIRLFLEFFGEFLGCDDASVPAPKDYDLFHADSPYCC